MDRDNVPSWVILEWQAQRESQPRRTWGEIQKEINAIHSEMAAVNAAHELSMARLEKAHKEAIETIHRVDAILKEINEDIRKITGGVR